MGTHYGWNSRNDVVEHLVDSYSGERNAIKQMKATNFGRHVWMLIQPTEPGYSSQPDGGSYISLFKLSSYDGEWGYKPISEHMGPCYYDCPKSLLEEADDAPNEYAKQWRNKVLQQHKGGEQ